MKVQLNDTIQSAIDYIIEKENYNTPPIIDVTSGSEAGDGYSSNSYAISIHGENENTFNLFVKYAPDTLGSEWKDVFAETFQVEFKFYDEIYPALSSFQEQKNIKEPFDNVPKHYKTNIRKCGIPPIILENLRSLGYTLRDRKKPIDDDHLKLPILTFAKYHAISYAMKDQDPEQFKRLTSGIVDYFTENFSKYGMIDMVQKCVQQFVDSLDPVTDKKMLDHCKNFSENLIQHTVSLLDNVDEYSVIGQGDCWTSNMMFLYDNKTGSPIDVKLIDWQYYRVHSPVLDFAYFFYTLATKEVLDNAQYYLNLYYNTVSQRTKELGSDSEKMYPYEIFLKHWRKFSLFGLSMAFYIVRAQLFEKDEIPDFLNSAHSAIESFGKPLKHQDKYINRMRDIVEYFINNGLI